MISILILLTIISKANFEIKADGFLARHSPRFHNSAESVDRETRVPVRPLDKFQESTV